MGINVRVQDAPKQKGIIAAQVKLEKDLRDCMRCKFFYGNNSLTSASKRLVAKVWRNIWGVICKSMEAREAYLFIILRTA